MQLLNRSRNVGVIAFLACCLQLHQASAQSCEPCADGLEPFLIGSVCTNGVDLAATLSPDSEDCKVLQLALYQADCCDSAPVDFCTLCEDGSQSFNSAKTIPRDAGDPPFEPTCEQYATLDRYVYEGATGICRDTERVRARAWCECDGAQPACNLLCDDGNPPPDMDKTDPIFGESCARFAYEYTTLTSDECQQPALALNFDAKAFCCNMPEPDNCSICPRGLMLGDPATEVRTEFFGTATCGEIDTYASYLPAGSCSLFLNELLDNPTGAEGECCVDDPNISPTPAPQPNGPGGSGAASGFTNVPTKYLALFFFLVHFANQ